MDKLDKSVTRLKEVLVESKKIAEHHFRMPSDREKRMTVLAIAKMLTELVVQKEL